MQHSLPKCLLKEHIEIINDLFEWLVDPCIEFIRINCKFQLETSFIHLMFSMMRLYTCMIEELDNMPELSAPVVS